MSNTTQQEQKPADKASGGATSKPLKADIACAAATCFLVFSENVLNGFIHPNMASVLPLSRDISTAMGALVFVFVAAIAWSKPGMIRPKLWARLSLCAIAASLAMICAGVPMGCSALVCAGGILESMGEAWVIVTVVASLAAVAPERLTVVVGGGFTAGSLLSIAIAALADDATLPVSCCLYFLCFGIPYVLVRRIGAPIIDATRKGEPATVQEITDPQSFLPALHPAFVAIFLFNAACGYVINVQQRPVTSAEALVGAVPLIAIFAISLYFVVAKGERKPSPDSIYNVAALLVIAGLLATCIAAFEQQSGAASASGPLLRSGSDVFSLLTYLLIAAMGARNKGNAINVAAVAFAASWLGINLGAATHYVIDASLTSTETVALGLAAIAFGFIAYNLVFLKHFSFDEVISGIVPIETPKPQPEPANEPAKDDSAVLDQACDALIERFRLTGRESDVLRLLARGRNGVVIQEKLFLSQNTVKTHVRHIYTKLDVHSHQELIDLVEKTAKGR